ncbi:MAG: hypothetical protein IK122_01080 [Alphaproteobacteria bacterium]|nr:hypothetical protein [Alphaproteobacteria bacterium]
MKLNVEKIIFGIVCFCALAVLCVWRTPLSLQTNLNSLVEINNSDWPINELTNKFSDVVNIVIESEKLNAAKQTANEIKNILTSDEFGDISVITTDFSLSDTINQLNIHKNSFLSSEHRDILRRGEFTRITDDAVSAVSSSMIPNVLSLKDDPFLLVTNYISDIKSANGKWNTRDGFLWQYVAPNHYILISADVVNHDTKKLVTAINSLTTLVHKYNNADTNVFLSGVPIHTANMTQTSKLQLTIFSLLALAVAILLNWLLFRKSATLLPVILSLGLGFIAGSVALFLCFPEPHILTFVFGTTLIGLGIDYSFHFISALINKKDKNVHKNILHSFLTTVVCFLPLAFSGLSLLQQISVFTIAGLSAIYSGWLIFMPKTIDAKNIPIKMPRKISKKYRSFVIGVLVIAILVTMPFVKSQNNMSQLYRPSSELLHAETLMQNLNGIDTSKFLLIRGKSLNDVLLTSEKIKDEHGNFFDISTVIPSKERQIENQNLIHALYKSESKKIQRELGLRTTPKFVETPLIQISDIQNNAALNNLLNKFMFDDGKYIYLVARTDSNFTTTAPDATTVSPAQQMTDLMKKYSYESYRLLAICSVALAVLLLFLYGKKALLYLMPSVLAVGLTATVLTWFNQPITFFHLLSLFIVIGLTLDYSIFHINATNNHETKPVLFSFLTSLVGFGILGFASFFLIQSMGITLGLGLTFGYLISLFLFRQQN